MPSIRPTRSLLALAFAALTLPATAYAQGLAGPYLAARHASYTSDYAQAADFYVRALARDPGNISLKENAIAALVGLGRIDRAVPIARQMLSEGALSQTGAQVLMADRVARGDYDGLLSDLEAGLSVGPLVDNLVTAWSYVGAGRMTEALLQFDMISGQSGLSAFGAYHKALALASVGDFEGANAIFTERSAAELQGTRRAILASAQILSQLEQNEAAADMVVGVYRGRALDLTAQAAVDTLRAGEVLPFTAIGSAADGVAEVFSSVASALSGEAADGFTLSYSRTAEFLRPGDADFILLSAGLLERLSQYDLATEAYDKVAREDPAFYSAELGRADAMSRAGNEEGSIEVLRQLSESHGDIDLVHRSLGDALRRLERYDEATKAYDAAIALHDTPEAQHWLVYFSRGITHEREGRWDQAEADFRLSLELSPDQPQVLNYLGYSLVELQRNLDEALGMIEKAVEGRPDDGYITDSLGWVLYRLGRYDEAVVHLERAVELTPVDPIINDHLGDVYWAVGRQREAQFQWRRAMSFDPEEKDLERIRRKLEVGLDKVLEEEGAEPLAVANDDG